MDTKKIGLFLAQLRKEQNLTQEELGARLGVSLFITVELGLSTLHAMTPAGTADGYAVSSMFYDILIADGGSYPDNCWIALRRSAWQTFAAAVINLDLTFLWMKHR